MDLNENEFPVDKALFSAFRMKSIVAMFINFGNFFDRNSYKL